jgi:hypothetical protein
MRGSKRLVGSMVAILVGCSVVGLISDSRQPVRAADPSIKLAPTSATVQLGGTLTVKLMVNTGGQKSNALGTRLSYDSAVLGSPVVTPNSVYGNMASQLGASSLLPDTVYIDLYSSPGSPDVITGQDTEVATIQFKALKAGSAVLKFVDTPSTGIAGVDQSGQTNNIAVFSETGGTYTVTTSPVTSSGAPATTKAKAATPEAVVAATVASQQPPISAPPPSAAEPAPIISELHITDIGGNTASVTWKTNVPTSSSVNYGMSSRYGYRSAAAGLAASHRLTLSSALLRPGLKFYVEAISTDTFGRTTRAATSFTTTPYGLTVRVVNEAGRAVKAAKVTIAGKTITTNTKGEAAFTNIPYGTQNLIVRSDGQTTRRSVGIGQGDDGSNLDQILVVKAATAAGWVPTAIGALLVSLVVCLGSLIWMYRSALMTLITRPSRQAAAHTAVPTTGAGQSAQSTKSARTKPVSTRRVTVRRPKPSSQPVKIIALKTTAAAAKVKSDELHLHHTPITPKPGAVFHPSDK